jgi:hypothetical protein
MSQVGSKTTSDEPIIIIITDQNHQRDRGTPVSMNPSINNNGPYEFHAEREPKMNEREDKAESCKDTKLHRTDP